jgi:hypothetical protein
MANWTRKECFLLVRSYFEMFELQRTGEKFFKAAHRRDLCSKFSRSEGSVEFKHINISAILDEQDFEWLPGYRPNSGRNYQGLLKEVVVEYLGSNAGRKHAIAKELKKNGFSEQYG